MTIFDAIEDAKRREEKNSTGSQCHHCRCVGLDAPLPLLLLLLIVNAAEMMNAVLGNGRTGSWADRCLGRKGSRPTWTDIIDDKPSRNLGQTLLSSCPAPGERELLLLARRQFNSRRRRRSGQVSRQHPPAVET